MAKPDKQVAEPAASSRGPVSVVIPTFNRADSLRRLLLAVESSKPDGIIGEVIVVDDGSTDGTAAVAGREGVRYLWQRNAGPAAAREHGWRSAAGQIIVFLDDDCVPEPDAVALLADALDTADGVGARIRPLSVGTVAAGFAEAEGLTDHSVTDAGRIRWLVTAAAAFRRSALERVGGFDLAFPAAGEDVDLTMRLIGAGCSLKLAPAAVVYHDHRGRLKDLWTLYYRRGRAAPRLFAKHPANRRESTASIGQYFVPSAWLDQYRQYRLQAGSLRSLAFIVLRATFAAPYGAGMVAGRSASHTDVPSPKPIVEAAGADTRPSALEDLRRLTDSVGLFRNWPSVLRDVLLQRLGASKPTLFAVTRGGTRIRCRNDGLSRAPIYQVFADDEYGLRDYAAAYHDQVLRVVDIGAHVGAFALAVCERLPRASVTSYEPSPTAFEYLRENITANHFEDRILAVPSAVSGSGGELTLYEASAASCLSSTVSAMAPAGATGHRVESISFDDLVKGIDGDIDLLKIDCEGREYDIVCGSAPDSWRRVRRLAMEYHPVDGESWPRLLESLTRLGFCVLKESPTPGGFGLAILERREPLMTSLISPASEVAS